MQARICGGLGWATTQVYPAQETHYGIVREFSKAGFYETERHRQILRELKSAVQQGKFVTMSGIVGCGKTTTLHRLQEQLETEGDILVAKSLSVDKECVSLAALLMAPVL